MFMFLYQAFDFLQLVRGESPVAFE